MTLARYGHWKPTRPRTLVVACSTGVSKRRPIRFSHAELGLEEFDRLYVPGGGGALSASDRDVFRAQQLRGECKYLVELHQVKQIILLFHGPARDGPDEAVCADYRRKLPWATPEVLAQRQARDAIELGHLRAEWAADASVTMFRCEVGSGQRHRVSAAGRGGGAARNSVGQCRVANSPASLVELWRRQIVVADGGDLLGVAPRGFEHGELAFEGATLGLLVHGHLQRQTLDGRELHRAESAGIGSRAT